MLYFGSGSASEDFYGEKLKETVFRSLDKLGPRKKVLIVPPDYTRFHSFAGQITQLVWEYYGSAITDILPALGTHVPMTDAEIEHMFGPIPRQLFRVHNWRTDVVTLGEVPGHFVSEISEGKIDYPWPAQVNRLVAEGGHDLILSVGQVVPHEVIGMANYNKNIFVGTGGAEGINKSHFLGAAYGMERIMGKANNPVRQVMNYASEHFANHLPIIYFHTVVNKAPNNELKIRGLYLSDDESGFLAAAQLASQLNFTLVDKPFQKAVVYLDPSEFKSTWLGNKAIYRTRMAMADGGELIILAPGVKEFGEDKTIDALIRKYGYKGTPYVLEMVRRNPELQNNLSAAAHLIHGSSEGRFKITWCPGQLSREEIENAGYDFGDLKAFSKRFDPGYLKDGENTFPCGTKVYYVSNPALGLWAHKDRIN